jgi:hypothetical protein
MGPVWPTYATFDSLEVIGLSTLPDVARRGWGRSIFLAVLAAGGTAAAQLGIGYGLGIVAWVPSRPDAADAAWAAALAWTVWIAATSTVVGAVVAERSAGGVYKGPVARAATRLMLALAATLGALVTVPLVGVPAQDVRIVDTFAPHLLAGAYAAVGAVIGLVVALLALASRAIAANVIATAGWLWTLAVIAVAGGGRPAEVTQIALWKFTREGPVYHQFYIPGALIMLGGALLIGGLAAFPAAGRGEGRAGVAISGAIGPIVVALAYTIVSPRPGHATFEQLSAFYTSPYMILAGLLGSGLVASVGAAPRRRRRAAPEPVVPAPHPTPVISEQKPRPSTASVTATASVPPGSRAQPNGNWNNR